MRESYGVRAFSTRTSAPVTVRVGAMDGYESECHTRTCGEATRQQFGASVKRTYMYHEAVDVEATNQS